MTERNSKIRALFLAGLMVLSVFAATMAFSGAVAASERGAGDTWETSSGSGNIGPGATLFQGEGDITYDGTTSFPAGFERSGGANEGEVLQAPLPEDQPTGSYDGAGEETLTVQTPRITSYDFHLGAEDGPDISGGSVPSESSIYVTADYNYAVAEDLEITVENADGLSITNEVLADGQNSTVPGDDGQATFELNTAGLDSAEYTVEVAGTDDLDSGDAMISDTFSVSGAADTQISLDQSEVVKGDNVQYSLDGSTEGDFHVVSIDAGDLDDASDANAFRNAGDTTKVDTVDGEYHYAVVEIDGGTGVGSIESGALDDTEVDVTVSDNVSSGDWVPENGSLPAEADDTTLTVTEGEINLENPTDFYVPGAEVTVNGTVSDAYDEVTLFARDQGEFERIPVGGMDVTDGEFEAEDADLTEGSDILSLPGTYRFAVVAGNANGADTLTASEVNRNVSDVISLRVSDAQLEANASIVDGQVAAGDGLDVTGVASGAEDVGVTFFGPRGEIGSAETSVRSDGTFELEDIDVEGSAIGNGSAATGPDTISNGQIVMSVRTDGRDGQAGDGSIDGYDSLEELAVAVNAGSNTQQQAIDTLSAETTGDTASDDQSQSFQFRLNDPRTTVDNVVGDAGVNGTVGIGSEMTVSGTTNRQPEQNSITAEVIEGPSTQEFDIVTTDQWSMNGQWNTSLNTSGLQPGTYTIEAYDGDSSDVMSFELAESVEGGQDQTDTPEQDTDTPEQDTDTPEQDTDTPDETTETDGQDGPGFGIAVALVALLAAALLAVRRNN